MYLSEELVKKWNPILEHADAPKIEDRHRRAVTAQMLENQAISMGNTSQALTEDSSTPVNQTGNVSNYDPVLISLVRRSMPNLMAYDVCGVQPMTGPTGLIFAMRPKYVRNKALAEDAFFHEADTAHSGVGNHTGSTSPAVLNNGGSFETGRGMTTNRGELLGTNSGEPWAEMGFEIEKVGVEAVTRALKAEYSVELAQDLKQIHGLDAETELANILSTEILAEMNRELMRTVYTMAKPGADNPDLNGAGTFDLDLDGNGRWSVERFKGLLFQVDREANRIAKETRRGRGNIIICNSDVASALNASGQMASPRDMNVNLNVDDTGNTFAGVLNGQYRVYIDPYHDGDDFFVMGYKGSSAFDAGLYYCPYVPLQLFKAIGEDSFQPRLGFKTRYGLVANPFNEGSTRGDGKLNANSSVYYRRVRVASLFGAGT
tara:strand:- start:2251 stop:3546 length:1296 start_codon:yes stop_codon:yes gene_type:complete